MSRPWMPLYVADYLRDTRMLTAAEHGAYLLLIMEYWTAGKLPDDDRQLCRIACMSAAEWRKAKPNVQPYFSEGWKGHKRVDIELAKSAEISSKRSASAKLKHSNSSANAQQMDTHAGATSQPQSPSQKGNKDPAEAGSTKVFAFESGVIRLNQRDFDQWTQAFEHLSLPAELLAATQWASEQRSWFNALKGLLAKKNRDVKAEKERLKSQGGFKWNGDMEGVL